MLPERMREVRTMRNYWIIKAGIKYPTTISIPIPTEPEMYMILAVVIILVMSIWMT